MTSKAQLASEAEIAWQAKSAVASVRDLIAGMGKAESLAAYQRSLPLAAAVAGGKLAALREMDSSLSEMVALKSAPPSGTTAALAAMKDEMAALNTGVAKALAQLGPTKMMGGYQGAMAAPLQATPDLKGMRESDFPLKWALTIPFHTLGTLYERWRAGDFDEMYHLLTVELVDNETAEEFAANCRSLPLISARADILADALWAHQQGKYALSVPVAMIQTEGILRSIGEAVGATQRGHRSHRPIREVLAASAETMAELTAMANGGGEGRRLPSLKGMYSGPFLSFLADDYFSQRRNPLMHGNMTDYATAELSAMCLLAMNEVIDCAVDVQHWLQAREEASLGG